MKKYYSMFAILTLLSGCIGARLGVRGGFDDDALTGVYGGPWVSYAATPVGDTKTIAGLEASMMFAEEKFVTIQPQLYVPFDVHLYDFHVWVASAGIGLDFGGERGVSLHLSGCAQVVSYVTGAACVRGSTQGWVGADGSIGVPVFAYMR